jgi:hypothetical protein
MEESRETLDKRYQIRFDKLERSHVRVLNSMQGTSLYYRKAVEPLQAALDDLVEHAYQLSMQLTALENTYAVQQITNKFDDDIAKMQKNILEADNPADRKEFEQTLDSLKTRKSQLKAIGVLLSRFEAQLTGTNNAVDSVVTGVISLQRRSSREVEEKVPVLLKVIQTEQEELKQFDDELERTSLI